MVMIFNSKEECRVYGRRGSAKARADVHHIEGENLTLRQIAERLGVSGVRCASRRLREARRRVDVVTWKSLGLKE